MKMTDAEGSGDISRPKLVRLLFSFLIFLCSIVAGLVIAEAGLRIIGFKFPLYPDRIEFGYPDPKTMEDQYQPDKYLFWVTPEYYEERSEAEGVSVVFMGDSCTQISYYDQYLARMVENRHEGQCLPYWNAGVAGWTSYQGRLQLERDVLPLEPEIVTFYFGWNDHWIGFGLEDKEIHGVVSSPLFPLRNSRIVQLVQKSYIVSSPYEPGDFPTRVSPEDFRDNLMAMVEACRQAGVTPLLITAPTSMKKGKEPQHLEGRWIKDLDDLIPLHNQYVEIVRDVAEANDVALCDLAAWANGLPGDTLRSYFVEDTIHLTPAGSEAAAKELYAAFDALDRWDALTTPGEECTQLYGMPYELAAE